RLGYRSTGGLRQSGDLARRLRGNSVWLDISRLQHSHRNRFTLIHERFKDVGGLNLWVARRRGVHRRSRKRLLRFRGELGIHPYSLLSVFELALSYRN